MTCFRIAAAFAAALGLATAPAGAAERVLFVIESTAAPKPIALSVLDVRDVQRPGAIPASRTWTLKPGDRLGADARPPDRVVELFTGTPLAPALFCRVALRYYRDGSGWTPQFRLDEEMAVAFVNGRWQPIGEIAGLVQFGNNLPNAEGFFPRIEFGASAGDLVIVAWQVR
jgi:hypothetical protein